MHFAHYANFIHTTSDRKLFLRGLAAARRSGQGRLRGSLRVSSLHAIINGRQ